MQESIVEPGKDLPESEAEFKALQAAGKLKFTACLSCNHDFKTGDGKTKDYGDVYSPAGWRETQISGECETCFDALFE
jgi:hypothetical protein